MSNDKKTLYECLGGYNAIAAFADDLLPRLQADPQLWTCPGLVDTYPLREEGGHYAQDTSTVFR